MPVLLQEALLEDAVEGLNRLIHGFSSRSGRKKVKMV